jgi:hypothetical protein
MYNEEVKQRYIIEKESKTYTPKYYLKRLFDKTEEHEVRLDKDVSNFTSYEITDLYKTFNIRSVESLTVMNSHLGLYTDWCLKQNMVMDCQNHFSEMNHDAFLKCINIMALKKSIVTRQTLYTWFEEEILNPSDAFIMLALFEGIRGKDFCEIVNLKMSDFSGNKVKLCTGRELVVSDKLVELAKISDDTMEYYSVNKDNIRTFPYLDEDVIVKNFHNCKNEIDSYGQGRRIYRRLMRNFEYLRVEQWMSASSLEESGRIDFIKTRSKELGISAKDFIFSDYVDEIDYKYETNIKKLKVSYYKKFEEYLV